MTILVRRREAWGWPERGVGKERPEDLVEAPADEEGHGHDGVGGSQAGFEDEGGE